MTNNKSKFEKNMRRLLKQIDGGTLEVSDITKEDMECLYECQQRGYIRGLHLERNARGNLIGSVDGNVRLLYLGYRFLDNRFPNLRSNLAIAISIVAIIVSILCEFTPIPDIVKEMFSGLITPQ